jgi:hypothetical protein
MSRPIRRMTAIERLRNRRGGRCGDVCVYRIAQWTFVQAHENNIASICFHLFSLIFPNRGFSMSYSGFK